MVHLSVRSWFSFLRGGSSPEEIVAAAVQAGCEAVALTDVNGLYGAVRFQKACRKAGVRSVVGTELQVAGDRLTLLARSRDGYAALCQILTALALTEEGEEPNEAQVLDLLGEHHADLICLAGLRGGLIDQALQYRHRGEARERLGTLRDIFADRLFYTLSHHALEGDNRRLATALRFAAAEGIDTVATNDVRYAEAEGYRRYDLLGCIHRITSIFDSHPDRPRNAEAWLKPRDLLYPALIPRDEPFARTREIAEACQCDLLPDRVISPKARLPNGSNPVAHLRSLCEEGLQKRIDPEKQRSVRPQLEKELNVIRALDLEEYFLVVHEVVMEAESRGIRYAGRGSAANSLVAYLLFITHVNPVEQKLLFERFLHTGRKGTPDIDVDVESDRRSEIIEWIEDRFGVDQTAMTGTVITYGLRSALRDVGKAYGWDLETLNRLSAEVRSYSPVGVERYADVIRRHLGDTPLVDSYIASVSSLDGCPRHLGLHSGGMLFTREPLYRYTPVQRSANGVRVSQFNKDDVEALGLIKFDVLGLRMLSAISRAQELLETHEEVEVDFDQLSLDDPEVYNLICSGKTLGLFQIESQGQMHLLAKTQPRNFRDLVIQVALFRPGPLQGDMVHPYTRRSRGQEAVEYLHPDLKPALHDTYGLLIFQEQILEVAHTFAGMELSEADDFRKFMSKERDREKMEGMRERFVQGATGRGVPEKVAHQVFEKISYFVGYGFCRSHAAAFAQTVYISAWLKRYHPASYFAAFMEHRPGMYAQLTLEEEAKRCGVATLLPDIRYSSFRFDLEKREGEEEGWGIRTPLTAIKGMNVEEAQRIVLERSRALFLSIEDLFRRVDINRDVLERLARSGALDPLAGSARRALWELGLLEKRVKKNSAADETPFLKLPAVEEEDVPTLPILTIAERLSWDYQTFRSARVHPMTLIRRELNSWEVRTIETCYRLVPKEGTHMTLLIAGNVVLRQMPPTAKGFTFITLEDETRFIQVIVPPKQVERLGPTLATSSLIVKGTLEATGNWRGFLLEDAWVLHRVLGGYKGVASAAGRQGGAFDSIAESKSFITTQGPD